jgi:hypothetical protein
MKGLLSKHRSSPKYIFQVIASLPTDVFVIIATRGVGSIKRLGGGEAPASRGTLKHRKGHLKNFSRKCWRRGGGGIFPSCHTEIARFLPNFFKKTWKFPNKKGTFDINLAFQRH